VGDQAGNRHHDQNPEMMVWFGGAIPITGLDKTFVTAETNRTNKMPSSTLENAHVFSFATFVPKLTVLI
jgi:hypothetical protein